MPRVKFVSGMLFLALSLRWAQTKKGDDDTQGKTVLFVCEHGAARSTIAAAYFNKLAVEMNLNYRALFRGTHPDSQLTPGTSKGLAEDGFDVQQWRPGRVTGQDSQDAERVITFDCALPNEGALQRRPERWDGIPAISKNYRAARDSILTKVKALLQELSESPSLRK